MVIIFNNHYFHFSIFMARCEGLANEGGNSSPSSLRGGNKPLIASHEVERNQALYTPLQGTYECREKQKISWRP